MDCDSVAAIWHHGCWWPAATVVTFAGTAPVPASARLRHPNHHRICVPGIPVWRHAHGVWQLQNTSSDTCTKWRSTQCSFARRPSTGDPLHQQAARQLWRGPRPLPLHGGTAAAAPSLLLSTPQQQPQQTASGCRCRSTWRALVPPPTCRLTRTASARRVRIASHAAPAHAARVHVRRSPARLRSAAAACVLLLLLPSLSSSLMCRPAAAAAALAPTCLQAGRQAAALHWQGGVG